MFLGLITFSFWPGVGDQALFFQGTTYERGSLDFMNLVKHTGSGQWLYHGDIEYSADGKIISRMAWRRFLWRQTWDGFMTEPLIGPGFGPHMFTKQPNGTLPITDGKWISGPHNSYLTLLYRTGAIGFALFLIMIFGAAKNFVHHSSTKEVRIAALAFFSVALYAGFNVCLENPQSGTWFWLFLGALANLSETPVPNTNRN